MEEFTGELLSGVTGEPVVAAGREGIVVEWQIAVRSESQRAVEGYAIVRWLDDGSYSVVALPLLTYRPEA